MQGCAGNSTGEQFANIFDKYIWQLGQIHLAIGANTFGDWDRYIWQLGQIHFTGRGAELARECRVMLGIALGSNLRRNSPESDPGTCFEGFL